MGDEYPYWRDEHNKNKSSARDVAQEFFSNTGAHGFNNVLLKGVSGRPTAYTIAIILSFIGFVALSEDLISQFENRSTVTNIEVSSSDVIFPAVTICNTNNILLSGLFGPNTTRLFPDVPRLPNGWVDDSQLTYTEIAEMRTKIQRSFLSTQERQEICAASRNDFIRQCTLHGVTGENEAGTTRSCREDEVTLIEDTTFCQCFIVNVTDFDVVNAGTDITSQFLSLELDIDSQRLYPSTHDGIKYGRVSSDPVMPGGVQFEIHDKNVLPAPSTNGVFVPAGNLAAIGLSLIERIQLPPRYGDCKKQDDQPFGLGSSAIECIQGSLYQEYVNACGCGVAALERSRHRGTVAVPRCESAEELKCLDNTDAISFLGQANEDCQSACYQLNYRTTQMTFPYPDEATFLTTTRMDCERFYSQTNFANGPLDWTNITYNFCLHAYPDLGGRDEASGGWGKAYTAYLQNSELELFVNGSHPFWERSVVEGIPASLNEDSQESYTARSRILSATHTNKVYATVFMETLDKETVEQEQAITLIGLIASIGGNSGLFLGASFITLFEWIEFAVVVIWLYVRGSFTSKSETIRETQDESNSQDEHEYNTSDYRSKKVLKMTSNC
eukprot:m.3687 g.3687  ORF g.3687 m.3687 type:complete len:613 (-) comp2808_c0_seq1:29-1867(-)